MFPPYINPMEITYDIGLKLQRMDIIFYWVHFWSEEHLSWGPVGATSALLEAVIYTQRRIEREGSQKKKLEGQEGTGRSHFPGLRSLSGGHPG